MAIKEFKDIVDRKGYLVDSEDRKIFEKEISKSNFGQGFSDVIEFVLYDSNDNQLPQGEDGKLVRYIHINDSNWSNYFYLPRSSNFNKNLKDSPEFFIDLERLVKEAGYSNGIFKTQVTLLNRRIGSEEVDTDKLWIHEISPSRTEVRLLPLKNNTNQDLIKRYGLFTNRGNFRDDTIYYSTKFIEGIDADIAYERFLQLKGKTSDGVSYKNLIEKEFKVDFEKLLQKVKEKYIKSMKYFIDGRVWNSKETTYGQQLNGQDKVELSVSTILNISNMCFLNSIEEFLPKRNIQEQNELSDDEQVTIDKLKKILKSTYSNLQIESTIPDKIDGIVRGCTDINALNYNPLAKENDGSCQYKEEEIKPIIVKGCTDPTASNYNKYASQDDGSCKYIIVDPIDDPKDGKGGGDGEIKPVIQMVSKTYYIWSQTGVIYYKDKNGTPLTLSGVEYQSFKVTHDKNFIKFQGDVREVPKIKIIPPKVYSYMIENVSNFTKKITIPDVNKRLEYGNRVDRPSDFLRDEEILVGSSLSVQYKDEIGNQKTSSIISVGEKILLCAQENSITPVAGLKIVKMGNCGEVILPPPPPPPPAVRGCTDPLATNYNKLATINDNSCRYKVVEVVDVKTPTPTPKTPTSGGGSGGGGGARNFEDVIEIFQDPINPFTNNGSYTSKRAPTQNIK